MHCINSYAIKELYFAIFIYNLNIAIMTYIFVSTIQIYDFFCNLFTSLLTNKQYAIICIPRIERVLWIIPCYVRPLWQTPENCLNKELVYTGSINFLWLNYPWLIIWTQLIINRVALHISINIMCHKLWW